MLHSTIYDKDATAPSVLIVVFPIHFMELTTIHDKCREKSLNGSK